MVTEEIKVSKLRVYPVRRPGLLKRARMIGFKGAFAVNFELPDYLPGCRQTGAWENLS